MSTKGGPLRPESGSESKSKSEWESEKQRSLWAVFQAVVADDRREAMRLLEARPELASAALEVGATRADAVTHFFSQIQHYAYAGDTALHIAAAAYRCELIEALVSRGASVRARNRRGAEPLHYACDGIPGSAWWSPERQAQSVALLTQSGADPNTLDKSGVAPLHRAARTRCTGAVKALLQHGADVSVRNKSGSTPLHLAVMNTGRGGSGGESAREEQVKIISLLVRAGARASDKDFAGRSVAACATAEWITTLLSPPDA